MHGHSYKLFVTVNRNPINDINNENGMVVDFEISKKIVKGKQLDIWDHVVLLNATYSAQRIGEDLAQKGT